MIESSACRAALRNGASRVGIGLSSPATKRIEEWRVPDARVTASFSSNRASEYRAPIQKPMVLHSIAPNTAGEKNEGDAKLLRRSGENRSAHASMRRAVGEQGDLR